MAVFSSFSLILAILPPQPFLANRGQPRGGGRGGGRGEGGSTNPATASRGLEHPLRQAYCFHLRIAASTWSPNNKRLAIADHNRFVHLFDENGERRDKFATKAADPKAAKTYVIRGMQFSPDSTKLAIAQSDNIVFVYKLGNGLPCSWLCLGFLDLYVDLSMASPISVRHQYRKYSMIPHCDYVAPSPHFSTPHLCPSHCDNWQGRVAPCSA